MYDNNRGKDKKSMQGSIESILLEVFWPELVISRHRRSGALLIRGNICNSGTGN